MRVAFIGDQGNAIQSIAVLNLIKDEGAHIVLHQGDFDYDDNPEVWDKMISDVLGNDFPYLASIGHHDELAWSDYQQKLYDRLKKNPDVEFLSYYESIYAYYDCKLIFLHPDLFLLNN